MDSVRLIGAVERALGRRLDDTLDDLLTMMRGCYILNMWGVGPIHTYDKYIGGPMSLDLGVEFRDLVGEGVVFSTDVDGAIIDRLKGLFDRGTDFVHAYSVLMSIRELNPHIGWEDVVDDAHDIEPGLGDSIEEAFDHIMQWMGSGSDDRMYPDGDGVGAGDC